MREEYANRIVPHLRQGSRDSDAVLVLDVVVTRPAPLQLNAPKPTAFRCRAHLYDIATGETIWSIEDVARQKIVKRQISDELYEWSYGEDVPGLAARFATEMLASLPTRDATP